MVGGGGCWGGGGGGMMMWGFNVLGCRADILGTNCKVGRGCEPVWPSGKALGW